MPSRAEEAAALSSLGYADPRISAASLRGPFRGETLVIPLYASTRVYNVPNGQGGAPDWRNRIVNVFADGGDAYIQLSTGLDANVDPEAVAVETLGSGRYTLTPSASGNGGWKIPSGQWVPIPIGSAQTFALRGTGKLRTHVAES